MAETLKPSLISRHKRKTWAICAIAGLAAFSVGPNYVRPPVETPPAYKEAQGWKQAEPRDERPRGNWWEVFNDAQLDALVTQVAITNQTIKAAEARVREARALTQAARAAFFPIVTANASATRSGGRAGAGTSGQTSGARNSYNVSLDVNWEIDLWGRVRRTVEASEATAEASAADLESAKLSAQAQLAEDYFLLRAQDAQIRLLNDTVGAYERSLLSASGKCVYTLASRSPGSAHASARNSSASSKWTPVRPMPVSTSTWKRSGRSTRAAAAA